MPFEIQHLSRINDMRPVEGFYKTQINPMGTVPALDDDGFLLESGAMLCYLADEDPDSGLLPDDEGEGKGDAMGNVGGNDLLLSTL